MGELHSDGLSTMNQADVLPMWVDCCFRCETWTGFSTSRFYDGRPGSLRSSSLWMYEDGGGGFGNGRDGEAGSYGDGFCGEDQTGDGGSLPMGLTP